MSILANWILRKIPNSSLPESLNTAILERSNGCLELSAPKRLKLFSLNAAGFPCGQLIFGEYFSILIEAKSHV